MAETTEPNTPVEEPDRMDMAPLRSGACPFCLRKHLLKARGYAREVIEDSTRRWEFDNLLENLLLAEDHATALKDESLASSIRSVRIAVEDGSDASASVAKLYDDFKTAYADTFKSKDSLSGNGGF